MFPASGQRHVSGPAGGRCLHQAAVLCNCGPCLGTPLRALSVHSTLRRGLPQEHPQRPVCRFVNTQSLLSQNTLVIYYKSGTTSDQDRRNTKPGGNPDPVELISGSGVGQTLTEHPRSKKGGEKQIFIGLVAYVTRNSGYNIILVLLYI